MKESPVVVVNVISSEAASNENELTEEAPSTYALTADVVGNTESEPRPIVVEIDVTAVSAPTCKEPVLNWSMNDVEFTTSALPAARVPAVTSSI